MRSLRSLPIIAKVVGAHLGIRILFEDRLAASETNKTIVLPSLKAIGSEEDAVVLEGLLDHEAGHARFTENRYTALAHAEGPLCRSIYMIIEDARMEQEVGRVYPGSIHNLDRMCHILRKLGFFEGPGDEPGHPASVLTMFLLYRLRHDQVGQKFCQDWLPEVDARARALFGSLCDLLLARAKAAARLGNSSRDSYEAALDILRMLNLATQASQQGEDASEPTPGEDGGQASCDEADESAGQGGAASGQRDPSCKPTEGQAGSGQDTDDAHGGDDTHDAELSDDVHGAGEQAPTVQGAAEADDAQGTQATDPSVQAGTQSSEGGQGAESHSGNHGPGQDEQGESGDSAHVGEGAGRGDPQAIQQVLEARPEDIGNTGRGLEEIVRVAGLLGDRHKDAGNQAEKERVTDPHEPDRVHAVRILTGARATNTALALKLDQYLQSRADVDRYTAHTGRLDSLRIANVRVGNTRVYERRDENEALDTALYILIDNSGSMDERIVSTILAAASVGEVVSRFDVKVAAASFNDVIVPIGVYDRPWRDAAGRMHYGTAGGTLMGAAVSYAAGELAGRSEKRKILLLVTDGAPNNMDALRVAVEECRRYGIETAAVLIQPNPHCQVSFVEAMPVGVAHQDREIPKAIFTALESLL